MNAKAIRSILVLLTLLSPWGVVRALDTDGGLVSDVWENYYGYGDLVHDADDDGDGVTNLWEYYFNLNPFVRDSHYLTITPVSSTLITVYFTAPFGQRFQWITTDDLVMGTWTALQGEITGTGNLSTLMEDPTGIQKRFYRITPLGALDQDDDGLDAHEEFLLGTSDILSDSDGDLVSDSDEYVIHSDPVNVGVSGGLFAGTSQTISSAFQNTSGTTNNYTVQVSGDTVETSDPTYSFVTSTQPGSGVTYTWQEISATGTLLSQISSALDDFEEVALTFSFPFYGQSHSSIFVGSNGYITLNAGSYEYFNYGPLPTTQSPPTLIAPFFDDLFPDTGGDIYFQDFTTYAIIQWTGVYPYSDGSGDSHFTFQVMIDDAGTIEFRYQNMVGDVTSATVGVQNEERTAGTNVAHNEPFITNGLAVRLTPVPPVTATWFTVSPLSFSLSDEQTQQLDIQLNPPANFFGGAEGMISIIENGSGTTVDTFAFSLGMLLTDADGDWVDDTYEAQSGMNASLNDADGDKDGDGLSNRFEFNVGLNANHFDSDNDLLPDGWEYYNGLNPISNSGDDGMLGDPDGDNLNNFNEWLNSTNPRLADTDGDGTDDLTEITNGGDPTDPSDGGNPPPASEIVSLNLEIGDHSGSESERYVLICTPEGSGNGPTIRLAATEFGVVTDPTPKTFRKGVKYTVTIDHLGTDPEYEGQPNPDYDYTAHITGTSTDFGIIDDDNILGVHNESQSFYADEKSAILIVPLVKTTTQAAVAPVDRKDIGILEKVDITFLPELGIGQIFAWSVPQGTDNGSIAFSIDNESTYTAPSLDPGQDKSVTVTIDYPGGSTNVAFNIKTPSGFKYEQVLGVPAPYPLSTGNDHIGYGRIFQAVVLPNTVSFTNVVVREVVPETTVTWPNGSTTVLAAGTVSVPLPDNNVVFDTVNIATVPISNLLNSENEAEGISFVRSIPIEYKEGTDTWHEFVTASNNKHTRSYSASGEMVITVEGSEGDPLNSPAGGPWGEVGTIE